MLVKKMRLLRFELIVGIRQLQLQLQLQLQWQ